MKIIFHASDGHRFVIPFPTAWLTSPTALRFVLTAERKHADISAPNIPPEAFQALCQAIDQIKKKHGTWELVHIEHSDGSIVSIIL